MRICNKCLTPISTANARTIQIGDGDRETMFDSTALLEDIELCDTCMQDLIHEIRIKYQYNQPTDPCSKEGNDAERS